MRATGVDAECLPDELALTGRWRGLESQVGGFAGPTLRAIPAHDNLMNEPVLPKV